MRKTFLIIVSLLLAGGLLSAQDWKGKGRINGFVTDPEGKPIESEKIGQVQGFLDYLKKK